MSSKPVEVAAIRDGLNMSQSQLAELLGVHPLTVSKWERGLLWPTPHQEELLRSFAKARKVNKAVGNYAKNALSTDGVIMALHILLSTAVKSQ